MRAQAGRMPTADGEEAGNDLGGDPGGIYAVTGSDITTFAGSTAASWSTPALYM